MDCPFCKNPMEKGLLQAGSLLVWVKKKHYVSLNPKPDEVQLDRNYWGGASVPAWLCRNCEKVIADYSDTNKGE